MDFLDPTIELLPPFLQTAVWTLLALVALTALTAALIWMASGTDD